MTDATTIEQAVEELQQQDDTVKVPVTYMHYRKVGHYGQVESRGGATLVIAHFPQEFQEKLGLDGECWAVGLAACSNDDNFDRKKGIALASQRLSEDKGLVFRVDEMNVILPSFSGLCSSSCYHADKLSDAEVFLRSLITLHRLGMTAKTEHYDISALDFISRELGMGGLG